MSDNMPNPTDWVQIYQHTLSRSPPPPPPPPSTTVSSGETTTPTTSFSTSPYHGPVGRGSRPIRRRSRASRRNPTTVFNTDTRNFRAMVQQFTGNQTGPFHQSQGPIQFFGPRNINPSVYNIQFQQQVQQNQQHVQQNQQHVQQNLPYTSIPPPQGQIDEANFLHGLGNTSSSRSNMEVFENLAMDDRINNPLPRQHQQGRD